jgi:hypothetical protein
MWRGVAWRGVAWRGVCVCVYCGAIPLRVGKADGDAIESEVMRLAHVLGLVKQPQQLLYNLSVQQHV